MDEKKIFVTKDYDKFKILLGNRGVEQQRVNKILKSIQNVGYITSPILVNEKFEVIDGQGRLEALRQLKMPVEYIIQEGLTIKECVSMNINQTNWNYKDYIYSYAERGYKSYELLIKLFEEFNKINSLDVFAVAVVGNGRFERGKVFAGTLEVSEEMYKLAKEKMAKVYDLLDEDIPMTKINLLLQGLIYCMLINKMQGKEVIDIEYLKSRIVEQSQLKKIPPFVAVLDTIIWFEDIYNFNRKIEHVFIETFYKQYVYNKQKEQSLKAYRKSPAYEKFKKRVERLEKGLE